jgi:hypothetical protein
MMSLAAAPFVSVARADTVFDEDWESGIGNWYVTNGVWQVGVPTVGPDAVTSGVQCAGTVLDGDYPPNSDTRLVSPRITLPSDRGTIRLKFWHWFSLGSSDVGYVQISTDNGSTWTTVTDVPYDNTSLVWTQACVDLSAYAGESVRVAFYFASSSMYESSGWYIDDVSIVTGQVFFENPEDFESGVGDWCADNGQWQVGIPTSGPGGAHTGDGCAATVLDGNYPPNANSRLISTPIALIRTEPGAYVDLFFWHWFSFGSSDQGRPQISVDGGIWRDLAVPGSPFTGTSGGWTQGYADLTAYADSVVQIGFYFTSSSMYESSGWYIDDLRIEGIVPQTGVPEHPEPVDDPISARLFQNSPNPCNPSTTIGFALPASSEVVLSIYNARGQLVRTLVDGVKDGGYHEIFWDGMCEDGRAAASGVYLYCIRAEGIHDTRRLVLLK